MKWHIAYPEQVLRLADHYSNTQKPEKGKIQAGVLVQCLPEDWVSVALHSKSVGASEMGFTMSIEISRTFSGLYLDSI